MSNRVETLKVPKSSPTASRSSRTSMHFSEAQGRWKHSREWRIFVSFVVFLFVFSSGLNFNVFPASIYCIEELRNTTEFENRQDLPEYVEHPKIRQNLFASYVWLAPLVIIPTLLLSEAGGAEWIFLSARIVQGSLEFVIPYVLPLYHEWVITLRIIQGGACGIIYALIGPICQKHTFNTNLALVIGISIAFFRLGNATPILVAGEFCKVGDYWTNFYVVGGFTMAVCVLWSVVMHYDLRQLKIIEKFADQQNQKRQNTMLSVLGTAAKAVLTNYSVYLMMLSSFCIHMIQFSILNFTPKFYHDVYDLHISKNRWFSVGPMLASVIGAPVGGALSDLLQKRYSVSISLKIVHTIGSLVPMTCMIAQCFVKHLPIGAAVFFMSTMFGVNGFFSTTVLRGSTAIKPQFSRLISGVVATSGFFGFIAAPYVVEYITTNHTEYAWEILFGKMAIMFLVSWLAYLPARFEQPGSSTARVTPKIVEPIRPLQ